MLHQKSKIVNRRHRWRISRSEIRNSAAESEGGAGIHFPHTPFSARPARAVWFLPRRRRGISFAQNGFAHCSRFPTNRNFRRFGKGLPRGSRLRQGFGGQVASRLRRSAFGLCALRKAIKSHGGQKEKEMDLSFSYLK